MITVEQLKEKVIEFNKQRSHVEELKKNKTDQEKILSLMQNDIIDILEKLGLKKFDAGVCSISISNKPYAKILDKNQLSLYLKDRGIYEDMVSFNASKMNSWFNEEFEAAKQEMNLDFNIPGMEVTSNRRTLSVRKGEK